jgi:heat-inducible transcriptional repressor
LLAVIREHIQTGEPVASRSVSRHTKPSLSPASIRSIMMELEEEGYLEQPHTSAGRVPTGKAYRYYVSQIDAEEPPSRSDEQLILSHLGDAQQIPPEEVLGRTSRVLSLVSGNLGVVIRLPLSVVLEHIHFVHVSERRILVVVVSPGSQVHKRLIRVEFDLSQLELEAASNYLNRHYRGWELPQIREDLEKKLAEERSTYDGLLTALKQLNDRGMLEENSPPEIFLEGASNLIGRPELADPAQLRRLIQALEEKETLVRLLTQCVGESNDALQVVIGLPGSPPPLKDFALIGSGMGWPEGLCLRMAILGPARMHYDRVIRAFGYIERLLHESLN